VPEFGQSKRRRTGQVVGALLIKNPPAAEGNLLEEVEIGWHLRKSAWGKGYATEAARAGLDYARDRLALDRIIAVVFKENERSVAVTKRLGMTPRGPSDRYYGVTLELFELTLAD